MNLFWLDFFEVGNRSWISRKNRSHFVNKQNFYEITANAFEKKILVRFYYRVVNRTHSFRDCADDPLIVNLMDRERSFNQLFLEEIWFRQILCAYHNRFVECIDIFIVFFVVRCSVITIIGLGFPAVELATVR